MLDNVKNIDIICLQFKHYYSQLDAKMKADTENLLQSSRKILNSSNSLKETLNKNLNEIFEFRLKAFNWLFAEGKNPLQIVDEVVQEFSKIATVSRLSNLFENVLFALRTNKRILDSLIDGGEFSQQTIVHSAPLDYPIISLNQYAAAVALNVPDELAQKIVDWTTASLQIEFVVLATSMIAEEKINISDQKINELSDIVVDAAHEYSALAVELGVIKLKAGQSQTFPIIEDPNFVEESKKKLANAGITDFSNTLRNYDA